MVASRCCAPNRSSSPRFALSSGCPSLIANTKRVGISWVPNAVDPTADPLNPPPPLGSEYERKLDDKVYRLLTKKALATNAMAVVGDCSLIGERKGAAAWVRLKGDYDPAGLTFTVNKVLEILDFVQDGCTANQHMIQMDAAVNEAGRE